MTRNLPDPLAAAQRYDGASPCCRPERLFALAALLVLLGFAGWVGQRGIEFGEHWDEPKLQAALANAMYANIPLPDGTREHGLQLIPHWYNYPSLGFDIACASMAVDAVDVMRHRHLAHADQDAVLKELHDRAAKKPAEAYDPVRHRIRAIFLCISLASGLWAFLLVRLLNRSPCEAFLAAAITLLGWEFGYHARWIAPDGLLASFCLLTILLLFASLRSLRPWPWVYAAALAAGLTVSSKYPGGVVLLPVLACAASHCWRRGESFGQHARRFLPAWALIIGIFVLVLLVTTPGLLIEPLKAFSDINFERRHYSIYGHRGHNTSGFAEHARLLGKYAGTALLSHYEPAALFLIILAAAGAIAVLCRRTLLESGLLLFIPVFFPLYLMSQKVMMVRNVMVVVPFLGILAALAAGEARRLIRGSRPAAFSRFTQWLVPAACAAVLVLNGFWAVHASATILHHKNRDQLAELQRFIESHPQRSYILSQEIARQLNRHPAATQPFAPGANGEPWLAFYKSELEADMDAAESNRFTYEMLPSGPYDVNMTYYSSWSGPDRILMVRVADIRRREMGKAFGVGPL